MSGCKNCYAQSFYREEETRMRRAFQEANLELLNEVDGLKRELARAEERITSLVEKYLADKQHTTVDEVIAVVPR